MCEREIERERERERGYEWSDTSFPTYRAVTVAKWVQDALQFLSVFEIAERAEVNQVKRSSEVLRNKLLQHCEEEECRELTKSISRKVSLVFRDMYFIFDK